MSNTFILVIYNDSISMWILYSKSKWLGHLKTKYIENFVDESLNLQLLDYYMFNPNWNKWEYFIQTEDSNLCK